LRISGTFAFLRRKCIGMKNILLASTSALFGQPYLEYLLGETDQLFNGIKDLVFIPYARPSGISHDEYTAKVSEVFQARGISVTGLHSHSDPERALKNAGGYFTGGGNTFLLNKVLLESGVMKILKQEVLSGKPYLGTSAGSNIAGLTINTTNDMPIVYPPSLNAMGLVPFNINPHYLDPDPESKHNGETRETRILEFLTQHDIPVVGLREGSWLRIKGKFIRLGGALSARIFEKGKIPYEVQPGSEIRFYGFTGSATHSA